MPQCDDPIVVFIASRYGLAAEMLRRHVDDGTGHCAGCAWQQASRPVHPCTIRVYAEPAQRVEQRREPPR